MSSPDRKGPLALEGVVEQVRAAVPGARVAWRLTATGSVQDPAAIARVLRDLIQSAAAGGRRLTVGTRDRHREGRRGPSSGWRSSSSSRRGRRGARPCSSRRGRASPAPSSWAAPGRRSSSTRARSGAPSSASSSRVSRPASSRARPAEDPRPAGPRPRRRQAVRGPADPVAGLPSPAGVELPGRRGATPGRPPTPGPWPEAGSVRDRAGRSPARGRVFPAGAR